MSIYTAKNFDRAYKKLTKNNFKLKTEIKFALSILSLDDSDARLRKHKLVSKKNQEWSVSANHKIRIIFSYDGEDIILTNLGSHDEVY